MIRVYITPHFLRNYKKMPPNLQEEIKEKIELFRQNPRHPFLKTHKLKGLKNMWSFWVNYHDRIFFQFESENTAALFAVGPHDLYNDL